MKRDPWGRIPEAEIDFSQSFESIATQYQDGYFDVRMFAVREVTRAEIWRLYALFLSPLLCVAGFLAGVNIS